MALIRMTEFFLKQDLSGVEIQKLIGKPPVLYSDLVKYKNLSSLLPKSSPYCVILYQNTKYEGHYVSIFIDADGCINFQDSYGYSPDVPINEGLLPFDSPLKRYLSNLIQKSGRKLISNTTDYQSHKKDTSDCGRYACLRILLRDINNDDFKSLLTSSKLTNSFLTPDNIAVVLTLIGLDDITTFFNRKNTPFMSKITH